VQSAGADRLAIHYQPPDPRLSRYISGYHHYALRLAPGERLHDVLFPGWTNLRFSIAAEPWEVRLGPRTFAPVPAAALFGPTSHAGYVDAGSGTLIGAGVTPVGWARLFGENAATFADRIVPLDRLLLDDAATLAADVAKSDAPWPILEAWFLARLEATLPEPPEVAALFAALGDPSIETVADLGVRVGLSNRALNRVSRAAFGFTPKLLLRRNRFMRTLMTALTLERGRWSEALGPCGYHDQSHFVRDCRSFLDMPLGAFVERSKPMAELSLRLSNG
jgi:AraC-like DNA-binding protein